jgi:hypothetical protein
VISKKPECSAALHTFKHIAVRKKAFENRVRRRVLELKRRSNTEV